MRFPPLPLDPEGGADCSGSCKSGCSKEDRPQPLPPISLAIILNLTSFGLATLALVALLVMVTVLHRGPSRPCHRCGRRVPLAKRVCQHCGYEFEPIRWGR